MFAELVIIAVLMIYKKGNLSIFSNLTSQSDAPEAYNTSRHKEKKYLIYTCIKDRTNCSGWGDRIKGISSIYMMAQATDRIFGINMDNPCQLKDYLVPNKIQWDVDPAVLDLNPKKIIRFRSKALTRRLPNMDLEDIFSDDVSYAVGNWALQEKLMQNSRYKSKLKWAEKFNCYQFYHQIYTNLFSLTNAMQNKLDKFLQKAKPVPGSKLICAQIRIGANPTIPKESVARNNISSVTAVWEFFDTFVHNSKHQFFVTTDSEYVRQKAYHFYGDRMLDTSGPIIHPVKSTNTNICEGFEKLILDQYILSKCDILVISRSGFGRSAAYLRTQLDNVYLFENGEVRLSNISQYQFPCKIWNQGQHLH